MNQEYPRLMACLLISFLAFGWATSASAAFGRDYDAGVRALVKGDLEKAEEKLRKAIEDKSKSEERVLISGSVYQPYVPYYKLGEVLHAQGDCDGAIKEWEESLRQGVIKTIESEYHKLRAGMEACQPQVTDVSALAQTVEQAINELDSANSNYRRLESNPDLAPEWTANWKPRLDVVARETDGFRRRLKQAVVQQDSASIEGIALGVQNTLNSMRSSQTEAEERIVKLREQKVLLAKRQKEENLRQQREQEDARRLAAIQEREVIQKRQRELDQRAAIASAQRELRQAIDEATGPSRQTQGKEKLQGLRSQLAFQIETGRNMSQTESVPALEQQTQSITDLVRRYQQAVQEWQAERREVALRTPPPELNQIANAYFEGKYEVASQLAEPGQFSDERQLIQVYLFRSASLFNLYWLTGAKNEGLLDGARQDINEIKRLDSEYAPYIAAFSPKYLQFFNKS